MFDAVFVGGGVIGLASAWLAQERGLDVCVLERGRVGSGASRVAAGILAPDSEAEPGHEPFVPLARRSLELYPEFVAALGTDVGFWQCGMLAIALDRDEVDVLQQEPGEHTWLTPSECRRLEPGLSTLVAGGALSEQEASIDPRRLVDALAAKVEVREGAEVVSLVRDAVTLANGETVAAGRVVVTAGAWSGLAGVPVRPVKGQVVRLRGELPAERMIRTEHVYVVPRRNGEVVVGATVEERGFDTTVTAGLRPGSPDNGPLLGEWEGGLLVATGHYRNGILLAPITAETVAALLVGDAPPPESLPFTPERFAPV